MSDKPNKPEEPDDPQHIFPPEMRRQMLPELMKLGPLPTVIDAAEFFSALLSVIHGNGALSAVATASGMSDDDLMKLSTLMIAGLLRNGILQDMGKEVLEHAGADESAAKEELTRLMKEAGVSGVIYEKTIPLDDDPPGLNIKDFLKHKPKTTGGTLPN